VAMNGSYFLLCMGASIASLHPAVFGYVMV